MIIPFDYEEIDAGSATPVTLTAAKVAAMVNVRSFVKIYVNDFPLAYRVDGGTPTATTYLQKAVGDPPLILEGRIEALQFQGVGLGGSAKLAATYYRQM